MPSNYTITLSDGVTTFNIFDLEQNGPGNISTARQIQEIDLTGGAGVNFIKLADDLTFRFVPGQLLTLVNSSGGLNDGVYTTVSSSFDGTHTTIILVEALTSAGLPLGVVTYSIPALEEATSLLLTGRGNLNFGEDFATSLVHLLENFASTTSPVNPILGQLWFNTTDETLNRFTAGGWTTDINLGAGSLTFVDPQHPTVPALPTLELTGDDSDVGASLTVTVDPVSGDSIFRVLSSGGSERLRVEHDGFLRTTNSIDVQGTTLNTFAGSLQFPNSLGIESVAGSFIRTDALGHSWNIQTDNVGSAPLLVKNSVGTTQFQVRGDAVVESNTTFVVDSADNVLVADAGTNRVGIGVAAPASTLDVSGESNFAQGPVILTGDGTGSIGETNGILKLNNNTIDYLFLGEGQGNDAVAPDIRTAGNFLLSADDNVNINIDDSNNSTGEFFVRKGGATSAATSLFRIENDGTIHSDIASYETLVTADNDIPNKKYVDDTINTNNYQIIDDDLDTFVRTSTGPLTDEDTIEMGIPATVDILATTVLSFGASGMTIQGPNSDPGSIVDAPDVLIASGAGATGDAGEIKLRTGDSTSGLAGRIRLQTGTVIASGDQRADVILQDSDDDYSITISPGRTGDSSTGSAGSFTVNTATMGALGSSGLSIVPPIVGPIDGFITLTSDSINILPNIAAAAETAKLRVWNDISDYVEFTVPTTAFTIRSWRLPIDDPSVVAGEFLTTDASGVLSFTSTIPSASFPLLAPAGTIAAPSYSFSGNTNTGIFSPSANAVSLATNSLERIRVESDGTMSAQTASYETLVTADNDIPNKKYVDDADTSLNNNKVDRAGDTMTDDLTMQAVFPTIAQVILDLNNTASNPGITHPSALTSGIRMNADDGGTVILVASAGDVFKVSTSVVVCEPELQVKAGSAADQSIIFKDNTGVGLFSGGAASNILSFSTNNTEVFQMQADGTLSASTASYETLVTADQDIPNKKYVDDAVIDGGSF